MELPDEVYDNMQDYMKLWTNVIIVLKLSTNLNLLS
jgi:hypothetical protein